jgi:hypothetical protein
MKALSNVPTRTIKQSVPDVPPPCKINLRLKFFESAPPACYCYLYGWFIPNQILVRLLAARQTPRIYKNQETKI